MKKQTKLEKEAQSEYDRLIENFDSFIRQAYLRGKIDALEGVEIELNRIK